MVHRHLTAFVSRELREDWENNRDDLLAFWRSGLYTGPEVFPDSVPWLFVRGEPDTLPWAAALFDAGKA